MSVFDWFKTKAVQDQENPVLRSRRSPFTVDITENIKINGELTRGLVHNTYPGYKLAGALAYAPIHTPVSIMGIPVPVSDNEAINKMIRQWVEDNVSVFDQVHAASHGDGTIWVWPFYNTAKKRVTVELIIDDKISDIIKDVSTGEIVQIISSEQITSQISFGQTKIVTRIRSWTVDEIRDEFDGKVKIYKNPLGIMPIPFSNEPEIGYTRGHSDLERIIPDLKAYHDVKLQWATVLSKMKPFLSQDTDNVDNWLGNNGYTDLTSIDKNNMDFVINVSGKEKTQFVFPNGAGAEYEKYLTISFYAIVQGSSIPELAWGLLSSGNHASTEEQMERLMSYCRKKQRQAAEPWVKTFQAIIAISSKLNMMNSSSEIDVEWNRLDALSEKTKSEILSNISASVEMLTNSAVPGELIHDQLKSFYPESTIELYNTFRTQRQDAAKFKQFKDASYIDTIEAEGQNGI